MLRRFRCVQIFLKQYNTRETPSVMLYTYINRHAGTPDKNKNKTIIVFVFCVFFPFILDANLLGCTSRGQTEGRSHKISHPPSFCGACLYFSRERRIQPFLSLVDREVEFCGIFLFFYFSEEKSQLLPGFELITSQRVRRLRGFRANIYLVPSIIIILPTTLIH